MSKKTFERMNHTVLALDAVKDIKGLDERVYMFTVLYSKFSKFLRTAEINLVVSPHFFLGCKVILHFNCFF